jgi:uncharacterized phage-associated protein
VTIIRFVKRVGEFFGDLSTVLIYVLDMFHLKFSFSEEKALEALTFIASKWPRVTPFFAAKVLYFAEKEHLNLYARPIVGDTFIAMPNGPVPSTIYDFIKGSLEEAGDPAAILDALSIEQLEYPSITAKREPRLDMLSLSDLECLENAITFCRDKTFKVLSGLTHQDAAWANAPQNGAMDYEHFIEGPDRAAIIEEAREFAAYGVL